MATRRWGRKESWALLKQLATFSLDACFCTSDFNEVVEASKKKGGVRRPRFQMLDFQKALGHCHLSNMGFCGPQFTWSNRRGDYMFTKERLDRGVANNSFASRFPQLSVEILLARSSDHAPLWVIMHPNGASKRRRENVFQFEAWWM
ncbi:uncharacterized protein LOC133868989 [Alnus glutinosa]|uniref:uncharacterized protein LOC133868989 n=1 Tax=Alnus glutinosa TaxID=3517 RepID=UPI002D7A3945|nr:uncharacterized protein LOC133868989 [Alnus glutinosa]